MRRLFTPGVLIAALALTLLAAPWACANETTLTAAQATRINQTSPIFSQLSIGTRIRDLENTPVFAGQVSAFAGTEAAPGLAFTGDLDCGLRDSGTNTLALVIAGADVVDYAAAGVTITGDLTVSGSITGSTATTFASGTEATPGIRYTDDTNCGFRLTGTDAVSLSLAGSDVVDWTTAGEAVTGTLAASGDFAINTNKFTVTATSGNTLVAGTFDSTGNATLAGTADVTGNFAVNTDKFAVTAATGNTIVAGTLAIAGDTAVATNKFTVASATGNTVVAGTLDIGGATEISGGLTCDTNKFTVADTSGNTAIAGTLGVTGATTLTGALAVNGGLAMDTSVLTVTDTTGAISWVPTNTTGDAALFDGIATTSGTILKMRADDDVMAAGFYVEILGGSSYDTEVFSIKEDGATAITSTAVATNSFSITNNTTTSGDLITLTADDDTLDGDTYYITMLGGTNHATAIWSVGEGGATLITPSAATIVPFYIDGTLTTSADLVTLKAVDATLNGGLYLECLGGNGSVSVASIGEDGAVTLAGTAAATNMLSITNTASTGGDCITLDMDDDNMDSDTYYLVAKGGTNHETVVLTIGEAGAIWIEPTVATANPLWIDAILTTSADLITLEADDDVLNGGLYLECLGGAAHDTSVFSIAEGGATVQAGTAEINGDITLENDETISNSSDGYINTAGILNPVAFQRDVTVNTDGSETVTVAKSGQLFIATKSDGTTTFTMPAPGSTTIGCVWWFLQTEDQSMKITGSGGDDDDCFVTKNSQDSDYGAFDQAGEKIGAMAMVIGITATKHMMVNVTSDDVTLTITDTD